jgi:hypothetical protein
MASIHKDIPINAPADEVWDAVRDFGAVHRRLAPGVLTDSVLDGDARIVTFANGLVARELLVDLDDRTRRVAYAVVNGLFTHHHASMQVVDDGDGRSHIVWISDLLPADRAPTVAALVEQGAVAMQHVLDRSTALEH